MNKFSSETQSNSTPNLNQSNTEFVFLFVFLKLLSAIFVHTVELVRNLQKTHFRDIITIHFPKKLFSISIHDCLESLRNKHFNIKVHNVPLQSVLEQAPSFDYRI